MDYKALTRALAFNLLVTAVEGWLNCMAKAIMKRDALEYGKRKWSWRKECNEDETWLLQMLVRKGLIDSALLKDVRSPQLNN